MSEPTGYVVCHEQPAARRQFHQLEKGEVTDLDDAIAYSLAVEARWRLVAESERAATRELSRSLGGVLEHPGQRSIGQ